MTERTIGPRRPRKLQREFARLVMIETDECVDWPHGKTKGYGYIGWFGESHMGVHRLACTLRNGEAPSDGMDVAHSCDNRACMNYRHLRWATRRENVADAVARNRNIHGEAHPLARLTAEDVCAIREARRYGTSVASLADEFGVSEGAIYDVLTGRTWRRVA